MTTFGQKLKKVRKLAGMTQLDLSVAAQTHQSQVSKWEGDESEPGPGQVAAIVRAFRRRLGWLTADFLVDDTVEEPGQVPTYVPMTPDEEILWVLTRDIGAV